MNHHPHSGLYFDPCHPRVRDKVLANVMLVAVSLLMWFGLVWIILLIARRVMGGA